MKMNEAFAIAILERMQNPEPYEPQITEEAYKALEMAIRALRWIPVKDKLPERGVPVLTTGQKGGVHVARRNINGEWIITGTNVKIRPKAWILLPEPYKEENKK